MISGIHTPLFRSAIGEMLRYDITSRIRGFRGIERSLANVRQSRAGATAVSIADIREAVSLAACFYFKPVLCLQKSVVTARLMRRLRIDCRVVIGCRQAPFFSHAWVETADGVMHDSSAYREQLSVLCVL